MMVGIGYDIHRLVRGRELFLGGVKIDFPKGLSGYSDGDVLIHAVCDALFGAANLGDIGQHFPPGDERYKDIPSLELLEETVRLLKDSGLAIINIDCVVITEAPKILPHVEIMKAAMSRVLGIAEAAISIKGKTNEGLGAIGAGEAIAAWAVCELTKKL